MIQGLTGRVLITGGTGSLGTAVLSRAEQEGWDCEFLTISRDEGRQAQLNRRFPDVTCLLGDIRDYDFLRLHMRGINTVLHFAAYKRVPAAQANVAEAIKTNVIGSFNVARAAVECDVKQVIATSTDKAAYPANVYGATKFIMEGLFQEATLWGSTSFSLTRYGNVIGSNGSVIPLFRRLVQAKQPLMVTNKNMDRFWLTLGESVSLVLLAWELNLPGAVIVPKAPAYRVWDLAQLIAKGEVPVTEGKIRPGEKLSETLITPSESLHTAEFEEVFVIHPPTSGYVGELPLGYFYSCETASRLTDEKMLSLIQEWEGG
jgi:UDP-N-acetylglucosamine 4,6-dehydratase